MARRIVIVGGGYTGAAVALQFAKHATRPLDIVIVEPRLDVGLGAAYSTPDPVLRLNVEECLMVLHVDAIDAFPRWLEQSRSRVDDPDGENGRGQFYARRGDFGRFMIAEFSSAITSNPSGSTVRHCQDRVVDLAEAGDGFTVSLEHGANLNADMVVVAIGNDKPAPLSALPSAVRAHPRYLADPWTEDALGDVDRDAMVLIVGTGLTAVDVVASLARRGHKGAVTAISRRGLMPRVQGQFPGIEELLRRNSVPVPKFIEDHGWPASLSQVVRWLRRDVAAAAARGEPWHDAVDAARDAAKLIWPRLTVAEKRRFFRHLKPFYDSHRFRIAPQIHKIIQDRMDTGQLKVHAARVVGGATLGNRLRIRLRNRHQTDCYSDDFDFVVNCTGPNPDPASSDIELFRRTISSGLLASDETGIGLAVNDRCETLRVNGRRNGHILNLGPMSKGQFAEVVAVPQITLQLAALVRRLREERLL